MTAILSPAIKFQGLQVVNGVLVPLPFGKLYTYAAGTSTPLATCADSTGNVPNPNPVVLDANGQANVWLGSSAYKFDLFDASGVQILGWPVDNIDPAAYSNDALLAQAIGCFSGALPPSNPKQGQFWYQPSIDTLWQYSGSSWSSIIKSTNLIAQSATAYTTGGTAPAFTLTPASPLTAYVAGQRFRVKPHAAGTSAQPTLNISGLGAQNWMQPSPSGALVPAVLVANALLDVEYDGTQWVTSNPLPPRQIQPLTATVNASALTVTLGATVLDFRDATLGSGTVNSRGVLAASLVAPSGATLGTANAQQSRIVVLALDNAGTIELAVVNLAGGNNLDETTLISTTALSAEADAANVAYSTTARTNLPFRVVGYIESTQATAGTWATAPSTIQGAGGQALAAMSSLGQGQTWQLFNSGTRALGTTYYNVSGRPILICPAAKSTSATCLIAVINGVTINGADATAGYMAMGSFIVPPNSSYAVNMAAGTTTWCAWAELR